MTQFFCEFVAESKTWFNMYSSLVMLFIFIGTELCTRGISVSTQEVLTLCQPFQSN